jgi:hypothetical protein
MQLVIKRKEKSGREKYDNQVTYEMVRPVHNITKYTKTYIRYNFLVSRKLCCPATLLSQWCQIS